MRQFAQFSAVLLAFLVACGDSGGSTTTEDDGGTGTGGLDAAVRDMAVRADAALDAEEPLDLAIVIRDAAPDATPVTGPEAGRPDASVDAALDADLPDADLLDATLDMLSDMEPDMSIPEVPGCEITPGVLQRIGMFGSAEDSTESRSDRDLRVLLDEHNNPMVLVRQDFTFLTSGEFGSRLLLLRSTRNEADGSCVWSETPEDLGYIAEPMIGTSILSEGLVSELAIAYDAKYGVLALALPESRESFEGYSTGVHLYAYTIGSTPMRYDAYVPIASTGSIAVPGVHFHDGALFLTYVHEGTLCGVDSYCAQVHFAQISWSGAFVPSLLNDRILPGAFADMPDVASSLPYNAPVPAAFSSSGMPALAWLESHYDDMSGFYAFRIVVGRHDSLGEWETVTVREGSAYDLDRARLSIAIDGEAIYVASTLPSSPSESMELPPRIDMLLPSGEVTNYTLTETIEPAYMVHLGVNGLRMIGVHSMGTYAESWPYEDGPTLYRIDGVEMPGVLHATSERFVTTSGAAPDEPPYAREVGTQYLSTVSYDNRFWVATVVPYGSDSGLVPGLYVWREPTLD